MPESRIDELLDKLRKLDSTTWFRYKEGMWIDHMGLGLPPELMRPKDRDKWLQGVIQDAISARADKTKQANKTWGYLIVHFHDEIFADVWIKSPGFYRGDGDTPTEALLAAYVQALEAKAAKILEAAR